MKFVCTVCGKEHDRLPALVVHKPDYWLSLTPEQQEQGKLSSDLCSTHDGHFFVRCVLVVPLVDGPERTLEYGVWSSLSEKHFRSYVDSLDDGNQAKLGPMFGWFSNELLGFPDSLNLKCNVLPQNDNSRPFVELEPTSHPLALAQRNGISFAQALDLVHQYT